jgi:hypothetical protein
MIPRSLPAVTGADAVRVVRALGAHRYVRGSLHAVHALAFDAVAAAGFDARIDEAARWAEATLEDPDILADSKDPRLVRAATPEELLVVLEAFWVPGPRADRVHDRLLERMIALSLPLLAHEPFDEEVEDDIHPLLVDAGWELLPLAELDPARHRGVIEAYGDPILFESARFEETSAIPPWTMLQELPALGPVELLQGVDADGALVLPLPLWTEGDETYQDYVVRGVIKTSKLPAPD